MNILDLDTIAPDTEKPTTKKPAKGTDLRRWWEYVGVAFALTFSAALVVAPTVITEVVVNNNYNNYLQETHLVNATITTVTPDEKSETLTPNEGEGSTLITRPHESYDTIGKTASVRVLSDGRFTKPPLGTTGDYIGAGITAAVMTICLIVIICFMVVTIFP